MSKRVEIQYRRHKIIASGIKGRPAAVVLQGGHRLIELSADTIDQAIEAAKAEIDRNVSAAKSGRRLPYIATTEEYVSAFRSLKLEEHELAMLMAHVRAPDHTLTATELAKAAGYDNFGSANIHYGKLGRKLAELLDIVPPLSISRGEPVWTMALAESIDEDLRWRLHPEVVDAVTELNIV